MYSGWGGARGDGGAADGRDRRSNKSMEQGKYYLPSSPRLSLREKGKDKSLRFLLKRFCTMF